jgi:hypothetical protein
MAGCLQRGNEHLGALNAVNFFNNNATMFLKNGFPWVQLVGLLLRYECQI